MINKENSVPIFAVDIGAWLESVKIIFCEGKALIQPYLSLFYEVQKLPVFQINRAA